MKVRHILRETAIHSHLFRCNKPFGFKAIVHFGGDHFTNHAPAFAAIKLAAMMGLHRFRRAGTSIDRLFDGFIVETAAYANDHATYMMQLRMIVNSIANGSQ